MRSQFDVIVFGETEIDRCEVSITDAQSNIFQVNAENFGDHNCENTVRTLADFGFAAEHGDIAAAIELNLHAGLRHVIPVDG